MSFLNAQWLEQYYRSWTADDLHDRHREITSFGGNESEKFMIEAESTRREKAHAQRDLLQRTSEGSEVTR